MFKKWHRNGEQWETGKVVNKIGTNMYEIEYGTERHRRHIEQLYKRDKGDLSWKDYGEPQRSCEENEPMSQNSGVTPSDVHDTQQHQAASAGQRRRGEWLGVLTPV